MVAWLNSALNVSAKKISATAALALLAVILTNAFINDDIVQILNKMIHADVLVLVLPVYFYSINAQIKTVLDRTLARWTELKDKDFFYILAAGEDNRAIMERSAECFRDFADCFKKTVARNSKFANDACKHPIKS